MKITPKTETHLLAKPSTSLLIMGVFLRTVKYIIPANNCWNIIQQLGPLPLILTPVLSLMSITHPSIRLSIRLIHRILILYNQCIHSHPHIQSSTVTRCDGPITHSRRAFMNRSHASHACGDHCCEQAGALPGSRVGRCCSLPVCACGWRACMYDGVEMTVSIVGPDRCWSY